MRARLALPRLLLPIREVASRQMASSLVNPGSPSLLYRHAWHLLSPALRFAEALGELRQVAGRDPVPPLLHATPSLDSHARFLT